MNLKTLVCFIVSVHTHIISVSCRFVLVVMFFVLAPILLSMLSLLLYCHVSSTPSILFVSHLPCILLTLSRVRLLCIHSSQLLARNQPRNHLFHCLNFLLHAEGSVL